MRAKVKNIKVDTIAGHNKDTRIKFVSSMEKLIGKEIEVVKRGYLYYGGIPGQASWAWHRDWLEFLPEEEKKGKALKDINVKFVDIPVCKLHWQLLPENKITICTLTLSLASLPHWKFKGIARCSDEDTWDNYEGMKWSMINKNTRYARLECYRAFVKAVKIDKKKKGKENAKN
jgi:hypothetical protein